VYACFTTVEEIPGSTRLSLAVQHQGGNIMSCKKFLGAACAALTIVIAASLALAPAAAAANKYKVLHAFHGKDGATPYASLIFDAVGNLYGTTIGGGAHDVGTVVKLTSNADGSWTESVLHSFNRSDGRQPNAALIFDAAGHLYGTTARGGARAGTVFELTPNADGSWTESLLHSFNGSDGEYPSARLIFDAAGSLYGTTEIGGTHNLGTVFKLTPNADGGWMESVLHSFKYGDGDGYYPTGGLIFDAAGNLYGTTPRGGAHGNGAVFKLTPNADGSWTESVLHSFNGSDGRTAEASLIFDAAGNLYSTTAYGGAYGRGTVFRLTASADGSWTESVLHSLNKKDGRYPDAGLIFDTAGNLYGTAYSGGSADGGAAFKLSPNQDGSWTYSLIHIFQGKPALGPAGGLVLGSTGTLYGTTANCRSGCQGVVYQITP
jgi:uncharacterized repeat protein (TIGR03803 family)